MIMDVYYCSPTMGIADGCLRTLDPHAKLAGTSEPAVSISSNDHRDRRIEEVLPGTRVRLSITVS